MSDDRLGIVLHQRWLAWGVNHGWKVRPRWLASLIVDGFNWVSCHTLGHQWYPEFDWDDEHDELEASKTEEFCPNCCAKRTVSA